MSGDFVQRGTPALFSKYVRAEMALRSGADLVLELPVSISSASAELFARGGVQLLDGLGAVSYTHLDVYKRQDKHRNSPYGVYF